MIHNGTGLFCPVHRADFLIGKILQQAPMPLIGGGCGEFGNQLLLPGFDPEDRLAVRLRRICSESPIDRIQSLPQRPRFERLAALNLGETLQHDLLVRDGYARLIGRSGDIENRLNQPSRRRGKPFEGSSELRAGQTHGVTGSL